MTDAPLSPVPVGLTAEETIDYLKENPDQAAAVRASEEASGKPRKTVLDYLSSDAAGVYDPVDTAAYPERPDSEALAQD